MFTDAKIDENELNSKLQRKLLWFLVITGCIANMVGFITNAVLFGMTVPTIVCGICAAIMVLCGVAGIRFHRQKLAATIMVLILALGEFPFLFYVYGSDMGVYLILGIIALAIYFPRPYHVGAIIFTVILDVAVMLCNLIKQYIMQHRSIIEVSKKLQYAAERDALTGAYNRGYLVGILNKWTGTEHKHFLAALLDIDNFKVINDTYGHVYGDEVLTELVRLMQQEISGKGIAARYGGEEFMMLFEKTDRKEAEEIINNIKSGLKKYSKETMQIAITFSVGVAEYCLETRIDEIFRKADKKLYQAKNDGKDRVVF